MKTNHNFSRYSARYAMIIVTGLAAFCLLESAPQAHAAVSTFQDGIVVGGTSLSSGLLLDVNGNVGANQFCNASGGGCVSAGSIGTVWTTSGNDIYNTNSANVGIGTSNPQHKLHTTGNIRADGRHIFLGSSQDIYGDNSSAIYYDSNHSSVAQIILRDASNNRLGSLRGDSGDNIGFLDDQGNWAIQHNRDNWTRWLVNNNEKMRLTTTGLGIGTNSPSADFHLVGDARINVGRGDVYIENNGNDNADGAGITLRTSNNPNNGSMFAVRSSGQLPRLWVGQSITSSGSNHFYVGTGTDGQSNASIKLNTNGDIHADRFCNQNGSNCISGRGQTIYQCPTSGVTTCGSTCVGQLSTENSCTSISRTTGGKSTVCSSQSNIKSCSAVGFLVNN